MQTFNIEKSPRRQAEVSLKTLQWFGVDINNTVGEIYLTDWNSSDASDFVECLNARKWPVRMHPAKWISFMEMAIQTKINRTSLEAVPFPVWVLKDHYLLILQRAADGHDIKMLNRFINEATKDRETIVSYAKGIHDSTWRTDVNWLYKQFNKLGVPPLLSKAILTLHLGQGGFSAKQAYEVYAENHDIEYDAYTLAEMFQMDILFDFKNF